MPEHWTHYLAKAIRYRAKLARLPAKQAAKIVRYHPVLKGLPARHSKIGY